ncbi:MAG: hypothetical protein KBD01_10240 [Acidobacteria bacterium]|nr:hypothetical protein [Acidobacteriota bacterium]
MEEWAVGAATILEQQRANNDELRQEIETIKRSAATAEKVLAAVSRVERAIRFVTRLLD